MGMSFKWNATLAVPVADSIILYPDAEVTVDYDNGDIEVWVHDTAGKRVVMNDFLHGDSYYTILADAKEKYAERF